MVKKPKLKKAVKRVVKRTAKQTIKQLKNIERKTLRAMWGKEEDDIRYKAVERKKYIAMVRRQHGASSAREIAELYDKWYGKLY